MTSGYGHCIHLDYVRREADGRAVAVALVTAGGAEPAHGEGWPPDPRFANDRALIGCIDDLLAVGDERPAAWVVSVDGETELPAERLLDLAEWCAWVAAGTGAHLGAITIAERGGLRGDAAGGTRRLPDPDDVELVLRRVRREAGRLGLDLVGAAAPVRSVPYGVPRTPGDLVLARHVAACAVVEPVAEISARWPWVALGPSAEDMRRIRRLAALVAEQPPLPLAIADLQVSLARAGGQVGALAARLGGAALDRVVAECAVPAMHARAAAVLRATVGAIRGVADARQGDYEACEAVMVRLWDRPAPAGETARSLGERLLGDDPWAVANACVTRARIANHRSDHARAAAALALAEAAAASEDSVRMRLLMVEAATLGAVAAQNRWPFDPGASDDAEAMTKAAAMLEASVGRLRPLIDGESPSPGVVEPQLELATLGAEPRDRRVDPTLGGALGTLGRTYAFLGRHDDATRTLVEARACFASALDRAMNACFLAHVELDRGAALDAARLAAVLDLVLPPEQRPPIACRARLAAGDAGFRFSLDLLLKTLAIGATVPGLDAAAWAGALEDDGSGSLLAIASALRSHPTELLARHAGETLIVVGNPQAAARWFALGVAVAEESGQSLARFARFTAQLAHGDAPGAVHPRGSILNPCYEYR